MLVIDLIYNLALLAALSVISGFIVERWKNHRVNAVMQGLLFGTIAVIGMLRPLNLGAGLIFDGRSVVISLCGLFFGPVSVTVSVLMAAILRYYQGGAGAVTGLLVISSSAIIGLFFYYKITKQNKEISALQLFGIGILVHIAMILFMFTLPRSMFLSVIKSIALPVIVVYPLATILIGKIISDNLTRNRFMHELKESESALRKSENFLSILVNTIPDLVWLKDKNGIYLSCNVMFGRFFGAEVKDIIGKTDYDFIESELVDFFREKDRIAMEAGKPTHNEEWITFADDGHRALLDTVKTPMYDDEGKLIGVLGISREITEKKLADDKIQNLLREKELLLQEVHHRIKNNMNTIKGLLSLQIMAEGDTPAAASLRDAESRVQSMIMLYDRLYCTENFRELSVKDYFVPLTEEIVGSFTHRSKIKINTDIEDFILNINKLTPLGIIVNELLTNMMKYAFVGRDSGVITLSASMKNDHVIIQVQDDGVGIPEDVDFHKPKGFGLELVNMLTEQIEGSIRIERGEGTKFVLEFTV